MRPAERALKDETQTRSPAPTAHLWRRTICEALDESERADLVALGGEFVRRDLDPLFREAVDLEAFLHLPRSRAVGHDRKAESEALWDAVLTVTGHRHRGAVIARCGAHEAADGVHGGACRGGRPNRT